MPNTHLPEPPKELIDIDRIRERLLRGGTDRDDHLAELDEWEAKVKNALIFLNLKGHEGVKMLLTRALEEVRDIDEVLKAHQPANMTVEAALGFAQETVLLQERKKLWFWFIELFQVAESDLDAIRAEIENELEGEEEGTADDGLEDDAANPQL